MDEAFAHLERTDEGHCKKNLKPPDGGWGYVVCIGVGFTFDPMLCVETLNRKSESTFSSLLRCYLQMLGFGSSNAFGILFNNFFIEQDGASGLPLVIGVYNGALSIAGFLSGIALKKYSFRQVGLVGAGLFVLGDILTIFVNRTFQLVFTFGVIRGAGFGVMIPVSFTAFNAYFTEKRTAMMSANQTMSSMASITFPMLVTYLLAEYGFRWTLALIMAVDLHLLFAMLIMHPVEWHMVVDPKARSKEDPSVKSFLDESAITETTIKVLPSVENSIDMKEIKKSTRHESFQKSIIKSVYENVEIDLLKNPGFVSTLVGLGFAFVSDVTYLAMEPMLLFSYGFTKMQVATCVMVGAIADLIARFLLAVFTYFYSVNSRKIFFIGTTITVFLRIALVSSSNLIFVFVVTVISGLVRCSVQVLFPLVLVNAAPDRFPAALALHIIFSGILMLIADPLIGVIYEATGSYVYSFLAMSFCCLVCVVLWTIEYFIYRKHRL